MKSLDEVIKALERCGKIGGCKGCEYARAQYECSAMHNIGQDALHYLKEYQSKHDEMLKMEEALGYCEMADNRPLSWDELKQMFHKPVWIETTAKKGWNIIVSIDSADIQVIHTAHRGPKQSVFRKADLGKTWNAYQRERKNEDAR